MKLELWIGDPRTAGLIRPCDYVLDTMAVIDWVEGATEGFQGRFGRIRGTAHALPELYVGELRRPPPLRAGLMRFGRAPIGPLA